jgi:hypothetical protein
MVSFYFIIFFSGVNLKGASGAKDSESLHGVADMLTHGRRFFVKAQVLADVSDESHGSGNVLVECHGGGVLIFHALSIFRANIFYSIYRANIFRTLGMIPANTIS